MAEWSDEMVDQIIAAPPERVIFNPGTENPQSVEKCKTAGISMVEACALVVYEKAVWNES